MKVALINGGSRGIGAAIVREAVRDGYAVAFTYCRSHDVARRLAEETGALAIAADSASEADIARAVREATDAFGHIDLLVNNAAVAANGLLTDLTTEEWNRLLAVDLTAPFLYSRAVLPAMISRKSGKIVNVSSMWGVVGASAEVAYSAAKAGLIGFTKALAKEVGPSGITVNAVAPGVIDTEMNAHLDGEDLVALAEETPLCRIGTPEEVARAVLFLASDAASFVTGEVLNVSGGFYV